MSTLGRGPRSAPAEVLRLPSPSPEEILSTLPVKPRTYNSLRRFVAGRPGDGSWSFGRLLQIPGFGTRALADWFRAQGAEVETAWYPGGHEVGREELAAIRRFLAAAVGERAAP